MQIERRYSKEEILELYLNQIYFGGGAYGAEAASLLYFDKHAHDLNLPDMRASGGSYSVTKPVFPAKEP